MNGTKLKRSKLYTFDELNPLVSPRSVAVVGASTSPGFGRTALESLAASRTLGDRVWAVNPNYDQIADVPCVPSMSHINAALDLVVVGVRGSHVPAIVEEAVSLGAGAIIIHSSGFGETGAEGGDVQESLAAAVRSSSTRLCGPNSLGLWNFTRDISVGTHVTGAGQGPIGIVSQSGSLGMYTGQVAEKYGAPASHLLFPGNSSDVDALDFANYLLDDSSTKVVVMLLEAMPDRDRIEELGRRSAEAGKPIVAYKLGRSSRGAAAALSHTGSLVGAHDAAVAVMHRAGLVVVREFEDLLETAKFFTTARSPRSKRVGVISAMGGVVVMACDAVEETAAELPTLATSTEQRLRDIVPDFGVVGNPVDVTATGGVLERTIASMKVMADDPAIDTLLVPLAPAAALPDRPRELAETARSLDVNVLIYWMTQWHEGPGSEVLDQEPGVAVFRSLRRAFDAVAGWDEWNTWSGEQSIEPSPASSEPSWIDGVSQLVDLHSNDRGPNCTLDERSSSAICAAAGIPIPTQVVVNSAAAAREAVADVGGTAVLKIASPDIAHKSDVGGVVLDVTPDQAEEAYEGLLHHVSAAVPDANLLGVIVAPMIESRVELFIGGHRDPLAGPVVVFGWGGTSVGTTVPPVVDAAPLTRSAAERFVDRLPGAEQLGAFRGQPRLDRSALVDVLIRVSELIYHEHRIAEIDINPLFVLPADRGVVAGDALIVLEGRHE